MSKAYEPSEDGVTHINIDTKGKSELGRWLSNFTESKFEHPMFGEFHSMEAYWHWVLLVDKSIELKKLSGKEAKKFSANMGTKHLNHFKEVIKSGIYYKIICNEEMMNAVKHSDLPFTHYWSWIDQQGNQTINFVKVSKMIVEIMEDIRTMLKTGKPYEPSSSIYEDVL